MTIYTIINNLSALKMDINYTVADYYGFSYKSIS